jgi:hypothetical protein
LTLTKVSILITIICLVSFFHLPQLALSQYTLPDRSKTIQYVDNLIDTYNLLVNEYDKPRLDFENVKAYFSLYHEAENNFKVIVLQTEPHVSEWVTLIFIPIRADQPNVTMDYNDTYRDLSVGFMIEEYAIQENVPLTYNNTTLHLDFVLTISASDISSGYMAKSDEAAKYIYQQDQNQVPTVSQTQTVSETISQTTTIQSGPDIVSEVLSNPLSLPAVSIVGILAILFLVVIPAIFGSDIDFVRFISIKKERDEKLRDFRRSARENKIKKQEKKQQHKTAEN